MRSNPEELRQTRENKGHSTWSLARRSSVSQTRICELEAASVPVRPTTAKLLADALDVDITDITVSDAPAEVGAS